MGEVDRNRKGPDHRQPTAVRVAFWKIWNGQSGMVVTDDCADQQLKKEGCARGDSEHAGFFIDCPAQPAILLNPHPGGADRERNQNTEKDLSETSVGDRKTLRECISLCEEVQLIEPNPRSAEESLDDYHPERYSCQTANRFSFRSEERRVGKECRSRGWGQREKETSAWREEREGY